MSPSSFPLELLNLIVDHLRDEPTALKASHALPPIVDGAFRDPSNTPACYTHSLLTLGPIPFNAASTIALAWVRTFHRLGREFLRMCPLASVLMTDTLPRPRPVYGATATRSFQAKDLRLAFTRGGLAIQWVTATLQTADRNSAAESACFISFPTRSKKRLVGNGGTSRPINSRVTGHAPAEEEKGLIGRACT